MQHEFIVVGHQPLDGAVAELLTDAGFHISHAVRAGGLPPDLTGIDIDRHARTVHVHGRRVDLTRTEYDLLLTLFDRPRHAVTRREIIDKVWGADYNERIIDGHASRLRMKVLDAGGPRLCIPVRGIGYRLVDA